jgi:radical SAM protein with 4Fe4S-binding SPASM domain
MERIAEECGRHKIQVKIGNIEEPLIHPKLIDFIRLCREKGVPWIHMTSNGLLLNEERARALLEAGITSLYVSIDAAEQETYKRIRGAELAKVDANVSNFIRLRDEMGKKCTVMVSIIRNEGVTEQEERDFCNKWLPSLDGVIIQNLVLYEEGNTKPTFINNLVEQYMERAGGRWACLNPWEEVYLLPDGRIYYCCETVSKLAFENLTSMGDYKNQDLVSIWQGKEFSQLRKSQILQEMDEFPACKECGIWMAHVAGTENKNGYKVITNMLSETYYPNR